jgi:hypothetical protein
LLVRIETWTEKWPRESGEERQRAAEQAFGAHLANALEFNHFKNHHSSLDNLQSNGIDD